MNRPLDFGEYSQLAAQTASIPTELRGDIGATHAIVCVMIASGAMADLLKKQLYYGRGITADQYRSAIEDIEVQLETLKESLDVSLNNKDALPYNTRILHGTLGRISEDAEMLHALWASAHNEHIDLDHTNVVEEAGDGLWYTAEQLRGVQELTGAEPSRVARANIAKLKARYTDKFDGRSAMERDIIAEREALEGAL